MILFARDRDTRSVQCRFDLGSISTAREDASHIAACENTDEQPHPEHLKVAELQS